MVTLFNSQDLYAANHTITHTIESETVVTSPSDRARKKLGIGEEVKLTLLGGHKATWTLTGGGKIDGGTAAVPGKTTVTYTAPDEPVPTTPEGKPVEIEAECDEGGGSKKITFTVVAPDGVFMEKVAEPLLIFKTTNPLSLTFYARAYITPNDVNFTKIKVKEGKCPAEAKDYFDAVPYVGFDHEETPGGYAAMAGHEQGKGTKWSKTDQLASGARANPQPYAAGTFKWKIPWKYKINETEGDIKTVEQLIEMKFDSSLNKATVSISKLEASDSADQQPANP